VTSLASNDALPLRSASSLHLCVAAVIRRAFDIHCGLLASSARTDLFGTSNHIIATAVFGSLKPFLGLSLRAANMNQVPRQIN